jgi:hypothetical protein
LTGRFTAGAVGVGETPGTTLGDGRGGVGLALVGSAFALIAPLTLRFVPGVGVAVGVLVGVGVFKFVLIFAFAFAFGFALALTLLL